MTKYQKILIIGIIILVGLALTIQFKDNLKKPLDTILGGQVGSANPQFIYNFGVVDIPIERAGAASSSTGFEFGKLLNTSVTAFTVASTSTGFAVTMRGSGKVIGCAFDLQTIPTTGTVSVQIQKNGTLQTGKYCKLPATSTFAVNGGQDDVSTTQVISEEITFVAGDRLGLIASSSNLNAATFDGVSRLIIELDN